MQQVHIKHFHLFCGLGGGARGCNNGHARVGTLEANFRCLGGVDSDPAAISDFYRLAGVRGTVLDMFDRDQYRDWHGAEPPEGWHECTPQDLQRAAGGERPNIVFTSPPCKGLSGLLSQTKSSTAKYQALNRLTVRGIWLALEAWGDDPPEFFILENVPRITNRGGHLLAQIEKLLGRYGYATARTTHDCGELGGLGQRRKRFLLVARHVEKVPPFLYEPPHRPLRSVGQVLDRLPLPNNHEAGAMHQMPALQWKTWVRLAFVEAGKDWRSLQALAVDNGHLRDFQIVPEGYGHGDTLGVLDWEETSGTVAGRSTPTNGRYAVADPRASVTAEYGQYGVRRWDETNGTVSGQSAPGGGRYSIADPRDPGASFTRYVITRLPNAGCAPMCIHRAMGGARAIEDPKPGISMDNGYLTAGHYGVVPWADPTGAVVGRAKHDTGRFNVADPRLPSAADNLVTVIRALDGTWHRPFTTLELAALQGLVEPKEHLDLEGASATAWRERIGNAVPPPAAAAIASVMGTTLLLARAGESFVLSNAPIWVKPVAVALAVNRPVATGSRGFNG